MISPCRCHQSIVSLNQKWRCEKNGEILLRIDFLHRFALTFFIIEELWFDKPATWIYQNQDRILPRRCCHSLAFLYRKRHYQKNGEKRLHFENFTVLSLTFFTNKLPFLGRMPDQWYRSPQTDVCPIATAALFRLWKKSGEAKRMVRKHCALTISQIFHSPFFN